MSAMLALRGLSAFYGQTQALFDVSLEVEQGGITTLLGANGAGKTTTLRAISAMIRTRGEIKLEGKPIAGLGTDRVARLGVAHVPDGRGTFTELTVDENLQLGGYTRRSVRELQADIGRMYEYFPRLKERRHQQAGTLSGGEQQMLAIGRALLLRPKLLLLDEPSFGLAPLVVAEIFRIMERVNRLEKVSILLVEQNAALALDLASRAYLIETGRIVMSGSSADIAKDEAVRRAYLGF